MSIEIKKISAQEHQSFYDSFEGEKSFLQTSQYGDWRETVGETNFRFGFFVAKELKGICQFQKIIAKRGTYLHIPHGPLLSPPLCDNDGSGIKPFLDWYKNFGKEQSCDFVRFSPLWPKGHDVEKCLITNRYRPAPVHLVNPEKTWILDITQSQEDILKNMKKSMRYEIRRIEKSGIKVQQGRSDEDLDIFWKLHEETVKRQGFVPFPKENTQKELELFRNNVCIFSSHIEQKYYSSSIIWFDDHSAYYHQGASEYSKLPVAHATLWAAIGEAQKRGCKEFNFWGVVSDTDKKHPWYGLSRFKRGFGGIERNYVHVHDFPITKKYWINWAIEKYRRWRKGY